MEWAALIAWVITAGGGFVLLAIWLQRGGMRQARESGARIRPPLILGHFALAAVGLVVWIVYVATDSEAAGWIALALIAVVALLGFTMLARWIPTYRAGRAPAAAPPSGAGASDVMAPPATAVVPAERHFPVAVVVGHGLLAATTIVLVLLSVLEVGS
jgi:hypothetical protein